MIDLGMTWGSLAIFVALIAASLVTEIATAIAKTFREEGDRRAFWITKWIAVFCEAIVYAGLWCGSLYIAEQIWKLIRLP